MLLQTTYFCQHTKAHLVRNVHYLCWEHESKSWRAKAPCEKLETRCCPGWAPRTMLLLLCAAKSYSTCIFLWDHNFLWSSTSMKTPTEKNGAIIMLDNLAFKSEWNVDLLLSFMRTICSRTQSEALLTCTAQCTGESPPSSERAVLSHNRNQSRLIEK